MKSLIFAAAASTLFFSAWCPVLHAQDPQPIQARTVICDTPEQMKAMLAKAEAGGRDALDPAVAAIGVAAVNAEAGSLACELDNYVFIRGPDGEVAGEWTTLPVIVLGYVRDGKVVPIEPARAWTATKQPGAPV